MCPYITIFEQNIPTYGLCYMLGIALCYFFASRRAVREGLSADHLLIIAAVTLGFSVLGAKLVYLIVSYSPEELIQLLRSGEWKNLLSGGLVFYGGLAGGLLGAYLGAKIAGTPLLRYENAVVPFLPLGYGVGRVGCFLAGCCYGFAYHGKPFPIQLVDTAISIGVCIYLVRFSRKTLRSGVLLLTYLTIYAVQRFLLEFLRGDAIRGSFGVLSTSQWISLGLLLLCGGIRWRMRETLPVKKDE